METNLRPLTLGEILDRTAQLYRTNFLLFIGISAVLAGAVLVLNLLTLSITHALHLSTFAMLASWWYQIAGWVSFLLMMVIGEVATAANNRAVAWVYLGEPASIASAYQSITARVRRYLWIGTLKLAIAWSPVAVLYGAWQAAYIHFQVMGVLPRPGEVPQPGAAAGTGMMYFGFVSIAFFLLMWPALIYGCLMALRYALALPASVVEGLTARQALRRSIQLSKGARGRIFMLWLLVLVVTFIILAATQGFFVVFSISHHNTIPWWLQIVQQLIAFCTNAFVGPMLATGTCLFYYDQRVRKEGYDIEWMMQAAGMTPAAEPAILEPGPAVLQSGPAADSGPALEAAAVGAQAAPSARAENAHE